MPLREALGDSISTTGQQALLEKRLMERSRAVGNKTTISPRPDRGPCALSFAQQRLWFLDQLDPGGHAYNLPNATRFRGSLNQAALDAAVKAIVQRHEVLRTIYRDEGGEAVQVVTDALAELTLIDLSDQPYATREASLHACLDQESRRPFDLSKDLLFRARLIKLDRDDHVLLMVIHHIACDGWSVGVIKRELARLYEGFQSGIEAALPELKIQYADFAVWHRRRLEGGNLQKQIAYWTGKLAGAPTLALPFDGPRTQVNGAEGGSVVEFLPKELVAELRELGRKENCTLFMTLLAAFKILLCRYTGQEDIVVGTPISGRDLTDTEPLVGFFINTLVLRTDMSGNPTFCELLQRERTVAIEAYSNQDVPFEKLVEELQPDRKKGRPPLFQAMFSLQNEKVEHTKIAGINLEPVNISADTVKMEFSASVSEKEDGLRIAFLYNACLFTEETVRQMLGHFVHLLTAVVADPGRRISEISLLSESERHKVLIDWNQTDVDYPSLSIAQVFENCAQRLGDAVAIEYKDQRVSYAELNRRSNRLCRHLHRLGVGTGDIVGIAIERSPAMIIALLATLKSGAAYLPLDTGNPKDRLATLLEDAKPSVILTRAKLEELLPETSAQLVRLDSDADGTEAEGENPTSAAGPDDVAYVMYTSGSTGRPKGVRVTHRGVVRLVVGADYIHFGPDECILQFGTLSFDASTFDIWGSLLNGSRLAILPVQTPTCEEVERAIERHGVTTVLFPTGFFSLMLERGLEKLSSLRQVIVGGDILSLPAVRTALEQLKGKILVNAYGPTEGAVIACTHRIESLPQGDTVPIGRPIANTQVYILDSHLQPLPAGVPGELYIGGDGIASGYLNSPELTAERFLPDPYQRAQGGALYKTGDLARFRRDGVIEFLGRVDDQVKIRGFRIEPAEIEVVLAAHPMVRDALVLALKSDSSDKTLVAYIIPNGGQTASPAELRKFLSSKLPEHMIPSAFVSIGSFPVTSNGKVDRSALPPPEAGCIEPPLGVAEPRNTLEIKLCMIWEELLAHPGVGIRDNFFDLGGHSLLAVRLFSQIEKIFGIRLPLAVLFQAPTIEALAVQIRNSHSSEKMPTLMPIQPKGSRPPLFCVSVPRVNSLGYVFLARHLGPDQPAYGLQAHFRSDEVVPYSRDEFQALAAEYIRAMKSIQPRGPYFMTGYCAGAHISFEMARQLESAGDEVGMLGILDAWPVENTNVRFLYMFRLNVNRFRQLANAGLAEQVRFIRRKLASLAPTRRDPATPSNPPSEKQIFHKAIRERYWPGPGFEPPTFGGRLALFRIAKQPYWRIRDPKMGWGDRALGGVEVIIIPGQHSTILRAPGVAVLAEKISDYMIRALIKH